METAIRFSQNATAGVDERFLYVDVTGRSLQLSRVTGRNGGQILFESIGNPVKTPPFRAFDWSSTNEALVVVGQSSGEATLLRMSDGPLESISFQVRSQRFCNAVALSTQNLLAAGLDRVRQDHCLNIWDLQQRQTAPSTGPLSATKSYSEPLHKLASSEPITSLKFFQDDPQLLVAGVKGQFVRLYDLREPTNNGALSFATRCVNNLAIDGQDENYFASCYPVNDPAICVWDRRMMSHSSSPSVSSANNQTESRPPEISLELKRPIEDSGTIWSLRFSKTQRGCLGVLSSTGHFKIYKINQEHLSAGEHIDRTNKWGPGWDKKYPHKIYLDSSQTIEQAYHNSKPPHDEKLRIVSFDFMTSQTRHRQSEMIALTGDGDMKTISLQTSPEPASFSSLDFFLKGRKLETYSNSEENEFSGKEIPVGALINRIRRDVEAKNPKKVAFKNSKHKRAGIDVTKISSYYNQAWNYDLGYFEKNVPFKDLLTLSSVSRLRCQAGYLFSASKNKLIVSDSHWLQAFWTWIERAGRISQSRNMVQDNLDLSFLGVYALWMEDISYKTRAVGPSSNKVSKIIEALSRRIHIPTGKGYRTEYPSNRQICLHISGLASTYEQLEMHVQGLVSRNQHTKAAALALFADERKLAYNALRQKSSTQVHRMLAMAIAGATKRRGTDDEDDWSENIAAMAEELIEPYSRAILAYVRSGDWHDVVREESLPLKYRVGIALRWFTDSALTSYISKTTKQMIENGDIEGVILTGTGTNQAVELMSNYIRKFGDVQTAVLALSIAVPRYVDEPLLIRRFEQWRMVYRQQINSWGLKYDRVRFDMGVQKFAVDANGRKLIEPAQPQAAIVCGYCSQSISQTGPPAESEESSATRRTAKHPLTNEKAAAIGTVCPKCGRHLPRCGVCDIWLGMPDPSYLSWSSQTTNGIVDLGASMAGSVNTTIGPGTSRTNPVFGYMPQIARNSVDGVLSKDTQDTSEAKKEWEEMVRKFAVFCIKCSHGFHAHHAKQWFGGYAGREGHKKEADSMSLKWITKVLVEDHPKPSSDLIRLGGLLRQMRARREQLEERIEAEARTAIWDRRRRAIFHAQSHPEPSKSADPIRSEGQSEPNAHWPPLSEK